MRLIISYYNLLYLIITYYTYIYEKSTTESRRNQRTAA